MKLKDAFDGDIYRRSQEAIAHGALTNSKRPESFVKGIYPTHLSSGQGCYVYDTHGNRYIDFICGLGSNLFGYAQEEINGAIRAQLNRGTTLSLGSDLEVKVAERVKEYFPFVERLRFLKTGSDACTAAGIIARAFTKKKYIYTHGYHGWHPEFISPENPANGIARHEYIVKILEENDLLNWDLYDTAAMIIEPVVTDFSEKRTNLLRRIREKCTQAGTLLIFDEIITGFRFPNYSVANHYGIIPDLICLGKAVAGGMPLSIVGGRKDVMESDYFVSSTFAGETLSLAACLKSMELFQNKFHMQVLWDKGAQFLLKFNEMGKGLLQLEGYPTRSKFVGDENVKALFFQEACRAGILLGPSFFFIFPHIEVMDEVLSTFQDILVRIKTGSVELQGELPQKPYAEKIRG